MINREDRSQGEEKMEKRDNSKFALSFMFLDLQLEKVQLWAAECWQPLIHVDVFEKLA